MLTQQQVIAAVESGRKAKCLDGRDYGRLCDFFAADDWHTFGFGPKEGVEVPPPKPWTREAIVEQMRADVAFGFEKALDQRGISAGLMHAVVEMWLWILEDGEFDGREYAQYGLPLFKGVAVKYGFENPIGADDGDEAKYASE